MVNGNIKVGYHSISWDASNNDSGIYFAKILSGICLDNHNLVLIK